MKSLLVAVAALLTVSTAWAGEKSVKIGVLTDLSSFASRSAGQGSVDATKIAVADFGGTVLDKPIEVVVADMQSKPDLAVETARRWYERENVDLIVDVPHSAPALAISGLAADSHKVFIPTIAASAAITGKGCGPTTIHWVVNSTVIVRAFVSALTDNGAKTWFLLMPDYAIGKAFAADAQRYIQSIGGKVLDTVYFPVNNGDFAQFVLRAQQSGADVIATGAIGRDLSNLIKQANEFGVLPSSTQRLAAFVITVSEIHGTGLPIMQGVWAMQDFYWDQNDQTRAFARKFFAVENRMPDFTHAGNYSAVTAYLNAVKAVGSDNAAKVVARMKQGTLPRFGEPSTVRADGRAIFDVGLYRVKSPTESKEPWDVLKRVGTIESGKIFDPIDKNCAVK
ncbi:MAG TPA: ABC transporter substrate-binding protein [Stellaceae bacterium]|jgi:branched-chain amino acid transport system substrate-binding protein|nr:ABC transporter substrate-binding protein [Stellaceae bacterium]